MSIYNDNNNNSNNNSSEEILAKKVVIGNLSSGTNTATPLTIGSQSSVDSKDYTITFLKPSTNKSQIQFNPLTSSLNFQIGDDNENVLTLNTTEIKCNNRELKDVSKINCGEYKDTSGDINCGPGGVYSYGTNEENRFIRFNAQGGGNDFLSAGAPLVINYNNPGHNTGPENVTVFGACGSNPPKFCINGDLTVSNDGDFASGNPNSRTLTVKGGSVQDNEPILKIKNSEDVSLFEVHEFSGVKTNYGTSNSGRDHFTFMTDNSARWGISMFGSETYGHNLLTSRLIFKAYDVDGSSPTAPLVLFRNGAVQIAEDYMSQGNLGGGTYNGFIPTISGMDGTTVNSLRFSRVGAGITVSGKIYCYSSTPILAGSSFDLTLPYRVGNFSTIHQCCGTAQIYAGQGDNGLAIEIQSIIGDINSRFLFNKDINGNNCYLQFTLQYEAQQY